MNSTVEGFDRRRFLGLSGGVFLAVAALPVEAQAATAAPIVVEPLPYAYDALEPYIDAETMHLHHDKHYQAYVDGLNKALKEEPSLQGQPVESLLKNLSAVPASVRVAVRNHGGGFVNHRLFWACLRKNNSAGPKGELAAAIDRSFGSFSAFQSQYTKAALTLFGSGWAWLSLDPAKQLIIEQTPNQDSVLSNGHQPLLGIDVWEHAYYLKYQNRRSEYVTAFYQVIDWDAVSSRYAALSNA